MSTQPRNIKLFLTPEATKQMKILADKMKNHPLFRIGRKKSKPTRRKMKKKNNENRT